MCENRLLSLNTIYNLVQGLNQVYDCYQSYGCNQAINRQLLQMIDKGNAIISKRILECYKVYENGLKMKAKSRCSILQWLFLKLLKCNS